MPTQKIFISYANSNRSELDELLTTLAPLERENKISTWSNIDIVPGEEWEAAIKKQLQEANIIIFLVSSYFMADDYLWNVELASAMERHNKGEVILIPVILRPCDWLSTPFAKLNALPSKGKPVSAYEDRDVAWLEVVAAIRKIVEPLQISSISPIEPPKVSANKATIQQLIGKSRLKEALELLEESVPEALKNDVILLKGKLAKLEKQNMLGLIDSKDEGVERAKIAYAALNLCE